MSAKNKWMIKGGKGDIVKISKENKISPFISRLLLNRDIVEKNDVNMFLKGNKKDLRDPFLFKDMDKAVNIIKEAISKKEKIVIYGDYDADGVTSTSILYKTLDYLNANFDYWIPKREEEGYGLNEDRIKSLKIDGAGLLLTCDNGISALSEI
ncbi:MAG: single-stranded-DNA-specific exonuclease RecJ, partial [Clostridium sp.]|nr:single-stranded-DNA-specific exonuclease RecJ [Clostridium sp.]